MIAEPTIPATCTRCRQDALAPIHWPPVGFRENLLELFGLLGLPAEQDPRLRQRGERAQQRPQRQ